MTYERLAILDCETSSLDPETGHLLEVAIVDWSATHCTTLRSYAAVCAAPSNEAEAVNGISPALLTSGLLNPREQVVRSVVTLASKADAVLAWKADFDRAWLPELHDKVWLDAMDIAWPRASSSRSLVAVALAHGVGVASAHRALDDVALLARLLERVAEGGADLPALLARAARPKVLVVAETPPPWKMAEEEWARLKGLLKESGFRFDSAAKAWSRKMPPEDVPALPFPARVAA